MSALSLRNLADHSIAIDVNINGREVRLRGTGELAEMSEVGTVLKIHIPDPAGEFDVILSEARFAGPILQDERSGCDYRICLQATDLVPAP